MALKTGFILRCDEGGLAALSFDFWTHLRPDKALVVCIGNMAQHPERFPGATVVNGVPTRDVLTEWIQGLDVVMTFETPYNWELFPLCRAHGVKTILCAMWEYFDDPLPSKPDVIFMPVPWEMPAVRATGIPTIQIPVPADRERFPFKRRITAHTFLAVLGNLNDPQYDRAGLNTILAAIPLVKSTSTRFIIRARGKLPKIADPRVTVDTSEKVDSLDNWKSGDVFIHPRRYAGLSLPMHEALSLGMPVLMSNMEPQNKFLPAHWLLPMASVERLKLRREIDIGTMDPATLAAAIDAWTGQDIEAESELANELADSLSWERLAPIYRAAIEAPVESIGRHSFGTARIAPSRPYRVAYVGNFSQPHCTEVHVAASLEALGCVVERCQENGMNVNDIAEVASRCDLLLYTRTWGLRAAGAHDGLWLMREMREKGIPTAALHLDLYLGLARGKTVDPKSDPFWAVDLVFSADGGADHAKEFERRGIKHVHLSPAIFHMEAECGRRRAEYAHDIVFVGSTHAGYHREWPFRGRMLGAMRARYGDKFVIYGGKGGRPGVRNADLNDLYASAKIVVGDSLYSPNYWSDRYFETIGRGGFLIAPIVDGLFRYLTPGEHYVGFEYDEGRMIDFAPLFETIDYYLDHDAERETIRRCGFEHVRTSQTYVHRMNDMIGELEHRGLLRACASGHASAIRATKLNVGCGRENLGPEWEHIDLVDFGHNVAHDLNSLPWPFADDSFDEVRAVDILEHLRDAVGTINEIIRVLRPGGVAMIQVPDARHPEHTWTDPEHLRGYMPRTFDYWVRGSDLCEAYGASKNRGWFFVEGLTVEAKNFNLTFRFKKSA